jgi:hypothetical protein
VYLWLILLAAIGLAIGLALRRLFAGYPRPVEPLTLLASREANFLVAAAEATFPAGGAIPLSGRDAGLPRYVDRWLKALPGRQRLLIRALFLLLEHATLLFAAPGRGGLRRFSSLSLDQRDSVLRGWAESRLFARRLVFMSLRAILTMGYLGHPTAMRYLRLAPYAFESPILQADLLYPPIGESRDSNPVSADDLTQPSDGTPLDLSGPLHPDYRERPL